MSVNFCCPIYHEPLDVSVPGQWKGTQHGECYPVVDGIPILLADPKQREIIVDGDWSAEKSEADPSLVFYNQPRDHDQYCLTDRGFDLKYITDLIERHSLSGPALEIGSGKGALQGLGGDYVAVDYSFTALRKYIDPKYQRVCATAERLPFFDNTFKLLFSVAALEHVPNVDQAFEEIHRVLAPGGVAYLAPAWHCTQYNCEGIPVRPYSDLNVRQKLTKLAMPLLASSALKGAARLPWRAVRRIMAGGGPSKFRFRRLRPDFQTFWLSDSDASSSIDSHESCLFFKTRGYQMLNPGPGTLKQLLFRHQPLVVQKS